jgi:predicted nucleic acid-binding protein
MLLLDNSAWARLNSPHLAEARREFVAGQIDAGELAVCTPFLLAAGYSARSAADHDEILERLMALPWVRVTRDIEDAAVRAQAELARVGHHRVAPSDLVIAACASSVDAAVLHYDRDFDVIAERTGLHAGSEWLAPRGSL